jgi:hypothetical protein
MFLSFQKDILQDTFLSIFCLSHTYMQNFFSWKGCLLAPLILSRIYPGRATMGDLGDVCLSAAGLMRTNSCMWHQAYSAAHQVAVTWMASENLTLKGSAHSVVHILARAQVPAYPKMSFKLGTGALYYNPSYLGGRDSGDHSSRPAQANRPWDPLSKITREKWTGDLAQAVVWLLCKCEVLSLNSSPPNNNNNNNNKMSVKTAEGIQYRHGGITRFNSR